MTLWASGGGGGSESSNEGGEASDADMEWSKKENRLRALENQVMTIKKEMQQLINEKNTTKNPKHKQDLLQQIAVLHRDLNEKVRKYKEQHIELKYRYPERFAKDKDRQYTPIREQTLDEIAGEMGLEHNLNQLKAKIDKKYEHVWAGEEAKKPMTEEEGEVMDKKANERKQRRLRVVK